MIQNTSPEVIRTDVRLAILEAAGRLTPEQAARRAALCKREWPAAVKLAPL